MWILYSGFGFSLDALPRDVQISRFGQRVSGKSVSGVVQFCGEATSGVDQKVCEAEDGVDQQKDSLAALYLSCILLCIYIGNLDNWGPLSFPERGGAFGLGKQLCKQQKHCGCHSMVVPGIEPGHSLLIHLGFYSRLADWSFAW